MHLRNIYSSRRIEEFCRNDIRFMWLTGNVTPDHNTINRFRSSRLKDVLKTIFATIVKFLVAEGFVSLDVACTDGTKMEPLEVLVVLEVSKYGFHILRSLAAIFQAFIREQFFTFPFLDFPQTMVYLHNSFRPASVTPAS